MNINVSNPPLAPVNTGTFPIQTTLDLIGTFIDTATGLPADPDDITLYLQPPNGPQQTYTYAATQLVRTSQGVYSLTLTPAISGVWNGTWQGTGAVTATRDFSFNVQSSSNIPG